MQKKVLLNITPQTWVRVTQRDKIFFRIPFDKLYPSGQKRKLRIERYNNYKTDLRALALEKHFEIPAQGCGISFFIPCPPSWSKKKKLLHHGKLHQVKPDLKNCLQAFEDALCIEDKYIAHYSHLSKRWVDFLVGWIELTISEPSFEAIEPPPIEGSSPL
jgi:Holliday junction resolvase RusA-like endonuclease